MRGCFCFVQKFQVKMEIIKCDDYFKNLKLFTEQFTVL